MEANADPEALPASLHDVAAVLIVRHLDHHRPEVVVRCLFDSYRRVAGETATERRVLAAERLAERRLVLRSQAWRPSQSRVAL